MKDWKKIVIILIVAVLAVCLLWKNGTFDKLKKTGNSSGSDSESGSGSGSSMTAEEIVAALTTVPNEEHRKYIRQAVAAIKNSPTSTASVKKKAQKNGVPFEKMVTIDAAYVTYYQPDEAGSWHPKYYGADGVFADIDAEIMNM